MSMFHIFLVAIIQGITEFLPVSSSGHLILLPNLTGLEDQGVALDIAVHVGTLGAVILFFWADVRLAVSGVPRLLSGKVDDEGSKLAFLLLIATVPVILFGAFLSLTGLSEALRSIKVIGWTMLIFGFVLWWADQHSPSEKTTSNWNVQDAIIMGLWQAIALFPGTSRSGITITGARQLGYERSDAARLAMLMSIPTIFASGALLGAKVYATSDLQTAKNGLIAALFAFVAAYLALGIMMKLLRSISFTPYVIYRVALGGLLLWIAYNGSGPVDPPATHLSHAALAP